MKKICTLIVAVLAVLCLAACGEEDKKGINVWATAAEQKVINAVVEEYNQTHEDKIYVNFTAISEGDCGTTLANDPTVKGAPALFLCADDQISNLQSKGIIAEIKGARKERVVASTSEVAVLGATLNDKLYGYPVTADNGYFLWYDGSKLTAEQAGSLETILQIAQDSDKQFLMELNNGWYANSFIMSPQACGVGLDSLSWYTNDSGSKVYKSTWDNEKAVKVSTYIAGLLTPYFAAGTLQTGGNDAVQAGFEEGNLIAAVSGTWMEPGLKEALGDNLRAAKLPTYTIEGQAYQMASFGGSKVYCINKTRPAEEQLAAANLAELLTSKEAQLKRFEIRATIPCNKEAMVDARYTENVSVGAAALLAQSEFACVQSKTAEDRYWDVGKAIGQAYLDSILGDCANWTEFLKAKIDSLRQPAI